MYSLMLHEAKIYFRQMVYWTVFVVVVLLSLAVYAIYQWDQSQFHLHSPVSPHPRYMVDFLGGFALVLSLFNICFFARNMFSKDHYYQIDEVVQSVPTSNVVMVFSKVLALTIVSLFPVYVFVICVQGLGVFQDFFDMPVVLSFEPFTLWKFLFITTPCSVFLFAAFCALITRVSRFNLLNVVVLLGLLILGLYFLSLVPSKYFVFFEGLPMFGRIGTDMVQSSVTFLDGLRYLNFVLFALLFCWLAVLLMKRTDPHKRLYRLTTGILIVACTGVSGSLALSQQVNEAAIAAWTIAYEAIDAGDFLEIDVQAMVATISLEPGENLEVDVVLDVAISPAQDQSSKLLFALNPGFQVMSVTVNGDAAQFSTANGVLTIVPQRALVTPVISIAVEYEGKPRTDYGYLDSSIDVRTVAVGGQLLSYLGTQNALFNRQYTALPQGVLWLPTVFERLRPQSRTKDFFTTDLTIKAPATWQVSLPGTRVHKMTLAAGNQQSIQFVSETPVASVDLFAGPLKRFGTRIHDIEFELLVAAKQISYLSIFEDHLEAIVTRATEHLELAKEDGYTFPCETVRLISVPHDLRVYEGGVFMHSITAGPCYFLLREHDFFSINFDKLFPDYLIQVNRDDSAIFLLYLDYYFRENRLGSNVGLDVANNFFDYQVGVDGREAAALELILLYLHDLIWTDRTAGGRTMDKFSINALLPAAMDARSVYADFGVSVATYQNWPLLMYLLSHYFKANVSHIDNALTVSNQKLEGEEVQELALDNSLSALLASKLTPKIIEAIRLRCVTLSQKLYYAMGTEKAQKFVQLLARDHRWRNLSLEDVYQAGESVDISVESLLGDWFDAKQHSVYRFSSLQTYLRVDSSGTQYYQSVFAVKNQGNATGILRTTITPRFTAAQLSQWGEFAASASMYASSLPGPIVWVPAGDAVQVGIVTETQPYRVTVQNTDLEFGGGFVTLTETGYVDQTGSEFTPSEPFVGDRESYWVPTEAELGIVVDDLDQGFFVDRRDAIEDNQSKWKRFQYSSAWGMDRPTFVYTSLGGEKQVIFETSIPEAGTWQLDFHIPDLRARLNNSFGWRFPNYSTAFWHNLNGDYVISTTISGHEISFDLNVNENDFGWVSLGEIWLEEGEVEFTVTPRVQSQHLFADAIRLIKRTVESN